MDIRNNRIPIIRGDSPLNAPESFTILAEVPPGLWKRTLELAWFHIEGEQPILCQKYWRPKDNVTIWVPPPKYLKATKPA